MIHTLAIVLALNTAEALGLPLFLFGYCLGVAVGWQLHKRRSAR